MLPDHATFGAAALWTVKNFYRQDGIRFAFVSDELNGINADQNGNVRPRVVRRFRSLSEAIEENAQSRIYLGIHWQFDAQDGMNAGIDLADFVIDNALAPRPAVKTLQSSSAGIKLVRRTWAAHEPPVV